MTDLELWEWCQKMAHYAQRASWVYFTPTDDLATEMWLACWKRRDDYEDNRGATRKTFYWNIVRGVAYHADRDFLDCKRSKWGTEECPLHLPLYGLISATNESGPYEYIGEYEIPCEEHGYEDGEWILAGLSPALRRTVRLRVDGYNNNEVGQEVGGVGAPEVQRRIRALIRPVALRNLKEVYGETFDPADYNPGARIPQRLERPNCEYHGQD